MPRRVAALVMVLFAGWLQAAPASSPRFYPDDPLTSEPAPVAVTGAQQRMLSAPLETLTTAFSTPGQRHPQNGVIASRGVNTLGDVMDGDWYVNRHGTRTMTIPELQRGSGDAAPPSTDGPWHVLVAKRFGTLPGLLIADAKGTLYLLRFDRKLLTASSEGQAVSSSGRLRPLVGDDIEEFLLDVPQESAGTYREVATRMPGRREALLGAYQVWGVRSDDPSDTVPHKHRRDLRGLYVFAGWLNIAAFGAVGTQDILVTDGGVPRIWHDLVDLAKWLGNSTIGGPKPSWAGNEPQFPSLGTIFRNIASLGVLTPAWMKETYPGLREVGNFGSQTFDPASWTARDAIAPFANMLPDDAFWAAKQVMRFTDDDIRAIVKAGRYGQRAEDWLTATLIERRNRIGRRFYADVLPLDEFRIVDGALTFTDLAAAAGFSQPRSYAIAWGGFDNDKNALSGGLGTGPQVPGAARAVVAGSYVAARIDHGSDRPITLFFRRRPEDLQLVGIDRSWRGRTLVEPPLPKRADRRVFADLEPRQQQLFATYADEYNRARGSSYTVDQTFERLTMSEQTTFYAISHALMRSQLTDSTGASRGATIDRVTAVERIAGQYPGRGDDEQFRLYVRVQPDTRDVLDRSREFFADHENTVYHIGYPHSFRQVGTEPNMQLSISDDGLRADIDVDYRSSRSPQALFNGHLTSANSDVRAGKNASAHNARWRGLVAWWQNAFGTPTEGGRSVDLLDLGRPDVVPTPLPPNHGADYAPATVAEAAAAWRELRRLMTYTSEKIGRRANLTSVIAAFTPRDPKRPVIDHPLRWEFLLTPVAPREARQYLCSSTATQPPDAEYYGVLFNFRIEGGGTLGLLWGATAANGESCPIE